VDTTKLNIMRILLITLLAFASLSFVDGDLTSNLNPTTVEDYYITRNKEETVLMVNLRCPIDSSDMVSCVVFEDTSKLSGLDVVYQVEYTVVICKIKNRQQ